MARLARADLVDPTEVAAFHCINRCVRRSYLCGDDPLTARNYDHRKQWLERRLEFLAAQFGVDVLGFAILSNHFHLVVRSRPDVVASWDDAEVPLAQRPTAASRRADRGGAGDDRERPRATGGAASSVERHQLVDADDRRADGPTGEPRGPGDRPLLECSDVMRYSSRLDEVGINVRLSLRCLVFSCFFEEATRACLAFLAERGILARVGC